MDVRRRHLHFTKFCEWKWNCPKLSENALNISSSSTSWRLFSFHWQSLWVYEMPWLHCWNRTHACAQVWILCMLRATCSRWREEWGGFVVSMAQWAVVISVKTPRWFDIANVHWGTHFKNKTSVNHYLCSNYCMQSFFPANQYLLEYEEQRTIDFF